MTNHESDSSESIDGMAVSRRALVCFKYDLASLVSLAMAPKRVMDVGKQVLSTLAFFARLADLLCFIKHVAICIWIAYRVLVPDVVSSNHECSWTRVELHCLLTIRLRTGASCTETSICLCLEGNAPCT